MDLTLEPALAAEEEAVAALWRECGLTVPYNDPAADFRFALGREASDVLVARQDGRVVATVMVGHDGHRGWLYYVAVAPALQGKGIGAQIVAAGEEWLKARGVVKLQLLVRETNTRVVSFYENLGFEIAPRVVMSKWLDGRE
ncbi:GCN5-related N-acetyltransferase [Ancylobacter novellus DSM 506]|uniref:GCN5-related N-acetyltransferase n=1 Tax=Ancylobacter novellus (strain ATCC 8093 / DSM 506 / JCM 20403 / CCM 1077 / IAM 12100 / NBRC 12443 / NCIMB 10456) TaxID=639283 RepID=D7A402_ANCN5|nr:GNAT family acetyltransferase [Ancylobacter novellus]ADH87822.1 GCN5-related N-acetyltransferase [Ancylobacter novellus DSM 506]